MCICINCRHIDNCITYRFIQKQHQTYNLNNDNLTLNSEFIPSNNMIQINIKTYDQLYKITLDWDLKECLSFIEKPGVWSKLVA